MKWISKMWKKTGITIMALLLLAAMMPAGAVQAASKTGQYQKKYKAQVSFPVWVQPAYGVAVNRIKNGKYVSRSARQASTARQFTTPTLLRQN